MKKEEIILMEWTLAGLLGVSALLLVLSIIKTNRKSKEAQKEIDLVHISIMKEINSLQESISEIDLDIEIVMREAGVQLSTEDKISLREVIDLYKRNYSIESIAEKKQAEVSDIETLIAPYQHLKGERRKVSNEN
jgi:hypothetical protein